MISTLGPQSSGKSTLLNYLVGANLAVSEKRCTKGVYGTYFKFSNVRFSHCKGLFIIDTEGLFALLNKNEENNKLRGEFDAKLVLFCLAVSDFVIVNTKGCLDSKAFQMLKSSNDRFETLTEQNTVKPEVILVLNQLHDGDLKTH